MRALRESMADFDDITRVWLGFAAGSVAHNYGESTVREWRFTKPEESLREALDFCELILAEAIDGLGRGRGHPPAEDRDFLIGLVAVVFRHEAPEEPRTHETSSLFYQVVAQVASDLGIGEENLSRRIKRVLSTKY